MENVLVTGASSPLGRQVLDHLRARRDLGHVVGVEPATTSDWIAGVELVSFAPDHRALTELIGDQHIETVVHCGLAPDRDGSGATREARVMETMRLGAALAAPGSPVRCFAVASSSSVYPVSPQAPLLHREDGGVSEGRAASLLEAEGYVRDVAVRAPHLNVSILRLQQLVGPGIRGAISSLLSQPVLPWLPGYDARLQLLAISDAVRALEFAAQRELAGVYNVASAGLLSFSEIVRTLKRRALPVLPIPAGRLAPLARRLGVPFVPEGLLSTLCFGHALDTSKLARAGFSAELDQAACLAALA